MEWETGMDSLWSAAMIKLIGFSIDDIDFADNLSRMIGERRAEDHIALLL